MLNMWCVFEDCEIYVMLLLWWCDIELIRKGFLVFGVKVKLSFFFLFFYDFFYWMRKLFKILVIYKVFIIVVILYLLDIY